MNDSRVKSLKFVSECINGSVIISILLIMSCLIFISVWLRILLAVEVLGGSGEKIVKAKIELEESAEAYTNQMVDTSNWINEQLKDRLDNIQQNQQKLDNKLIQVLSGFAKEHHNLKFVSTSLVNSTSVLLKRQKQLLVQTETAKISAHQTVIIA